MYNRRTVLITSVSIVGISGCTADGGSSEEPTSEKPTSEEESLENRYPDYYAIHEPTELVVLNDVEASADSYSVTITGTVVNGSNTNYDYAQIEFGLYDETGAKAGNAIDNISKLASGQRWRYEAIGTAEEASKWELDGMTAY